MGLYKSLEDAYYGFMDFLDQKLHIPVYDIFVNPIEKTGTASLPVFLIIILLLVGGIAGAVYFLTMQPQSATLKVVVLSGEDSVPGATVKITSDDLEFTATADADGLAVFEKLPKGKTFKVEVVAQDYLPGSDELLLEDTASLTIRLEVVELDINILVSVTDDAGAPIAGARIQYSTAEGSASAVTGANGNAKITSKKDADISLEVSKEDYEKVYESAIATGETIRITMKKKAAPQPPADKGKLKVTVVDEAQKELDDVTVSIFDSSGGATPLDTQSTAEGIALFYDLEVGSKIKVTVSAPKFKDDKQTVTIKADTKVKFIMKADFTPPPADVTSVTVKDGAAKTALEGATVYLFKPEDELVFTEKTDSGGQAIFEDAKLEPYYAIVTAPDYMYGKVFIIGGEQKEISLYKAKDQLNAELAVAVKDEDGKVLPNAKVAIFDETTDVVPPFEQKTDAKGEYKVKLPLAYYTVKITSGALAGEDSVDLDKNYRMNITVSFPRGTLSLFAMDMDTNKSILTNGTNRTTSFTVKITDNVKKNTTSTVCNANPCLMQLIATRSYKLSLSANGYYDSEAPLMEKEIKPDETTFRNISMKNTSSPANLKIRLEGMLDLQNPNAALTEVKPGKIYALRFSAFFDNSSRKGIYLRVGEQLELEGSSNSSADGYLVDYSMSGTPAPTSVKGASYYLPDVCTPLSSPSKARWAFIEYPTIGSTVLLITVKTNSIKRAPEALDIFYYGYSVLANGTLYSDPTGISQVEQCNARTYPYSLPFVKTGGLNEQCNAPPLPECDSIENFCSTETNRCIPEPRINPSDFCNSTEVQKVFSMKDGGAMVVMKEEAGIEFYTRKGEVYKECPGDDTIEQSGDCEKLLGNRSSTTPLCDFTPRVDPNTYCGSPEVARVEVCADSSAKVTTIINKEEKASYFRLDGKLLQRDCPAQPAPANEECYDLNNNCDPGTPIVCEKICPNGNVKQQDYCNDDAVQYVKTCPAGIKVVSLVAEEEIADYFDVCGEVLEENCPANPSPADGECYQLNTGCDAARLLCKAPPTLPEPDYRECTSLQITKTAKGNILPSAPRVVFKVDPIFPADGIPISFVSEDGSSMFQRIEFYDKAARVDQCFKWDQRNNLLLYDPGQTGCPDKYKPIGNEIIGGNFTMKISISPNPVPLAMDILVLTDEDVPIDQRVDLPAIDASMIEYKQPDATPFSYYGYNDQAYSPLRLAYVLNNRQLTSQMDDFAGGVYSTSTSYNEFVINLLMRSSNRGGAAIFGWNTNSRPALTIAAKTGGSGRFPILDLDPQAHREGSIPDLMGWAQDYTEDEEYMSNAFPSERMASFMEMVEKTAANSVFRRGGLAPYSYFVRNPGTTPVKFSMVVAERANAVFNVFNQEGFSIKVKDTAHECDARIGLYRLSTQTSDGETWGVDGYNFVLEPMNLTESRNFNCDGVPACNLFDQFYGAADYFPEAGETHCFATEWPLVPDGREDYYTHEGLDLRSSSANFLGVFDDAKAELESYDALEAFPVFALDLRQDEALTRAMILYRFDNETTDNVEELGPYSIERHPKFFVGDLTACIDEDEDGYGLNGVRMCEHSAIDCNDEPAGASGVPGNEINPEMSEELHNGVDDDCNPLTRDDGKPALQITDISCTSTPNKDLNIRWTTNVKDVEGKGGLKEPEESIITWRDNPGVSADGYTYNTTFSSLVTGVTYEMFASAFYGDDGQSNVIRRACCKPGVGAVACPGPVTMCGDVNGDQSWDIMDLVALIDIRGREGTPANFESIDMNGDGSLNDADQGILINYLFAGGSFPQCSQTASTCTIDGSGYANNAPRDGNSCQFCNISNSHTEWSERLPTTPCNNGGSCNSDGLCLGGTCSANSDCFGNQNCSAGGRCGGAATADICTKDGTTFSLTKAQATQIAGAASACTQVGPLSNNYLCNSGTGTYWIDIDETTPTQGCSPACVVDVQTHVAELNSRCTGLLLECDGKTDGTPCTGGTCQNGACVEGTPTCTDSDSHSYTVKGTTTATGQTPKEDVCNSDSQLKEWYCQNNAPVSEDHDCGTGKVCVLGACIDQPAGLTATEPTDTTTTDNHATITWDTPGMATTSLVFLSLNGGGFIKRYDSDGSLNTQHVAVLPEEAGLALSPGPYTYKIGGCKTSGYDQYVVAAATSDNIIDNPSAAADCYLKTSSTYTFSISNNPPSIPTIVRVLDASSITTTAATLKWETDIQPARNKVCTRQGPVEFGGYSELSFSDYGKKISFEIRTAEGGGGGGGGGYTPAASPTIEPTCTVRTCSEQPGQTLQTCRITGLMANRIVYFKVQSCKSATDSSSCSEWSAEKFFDT